MSLFEKKKDNNSFIQPFRFTKEELLIASKIQQRRLQMLIHSRLYYKLDVSLITDSQFDTWGKELSQLQNDYPDIAKKICYSNQFKDWDGSTGIHLPLEDPWIIKKTDYLLKIAEKRGDEIKYQKMLKSTGERSGKGNKWKKTVKQRSNSVQKRGLF